MAVWRGEDLNEQIRKRPVCAGIVDEKDREMNKTGEKKVIRTWSSIYNFPQMVGHTLPFTMEETCAYLCD